MKKSNIEKREELAVHAVEQIQKAVLGFMKGGHVVEAFLNYRSGLKRKRLVDFTDSLKQVFESELSIDLDDYNFESEDFVDLIDLIMNKVQTTKSIEKLNAFRGIFINSLILDSFDLTQVYIELTTSLHEKQIEILRKFISTNEDRKKSSKVINELSQLYEEIESRKKHLKELIDKGKLGTNESYTQATMDEVRTLALLSKARDDHKRLVDSINAIHFGIESSKYNYFVRDLISKGLLVENTYVSFDTTVVDSIDAMDFAIDYYKFVTIDD